MTMQVDLPWSVIVDPVFAEVRVCAGQNFYLCQTAPGTGHEAQITITPEGALALADAIYASYGNLKKDTRQ